MLLEKLIEVVEKKRKCEIDKADCNKDCFTCDCALTVKQVKEMYADIQMRLKQEKWARDKMEEMRFDNDSIDERYKEDE